MALLDHLFFLNVITVNIEHQLDRIYAEDLWFLLGGAAAHKSS